MVSRHRVLPPSTGVRILNWSTFFAKAACVEVGRIGALRAAAHGMSNSVASFRDTLAWCPVCVREDVARWGESYEHAIWRLSCCAVCVAHGQVLVQICPICARGRGEYHPSGGRWRLVCESCNGRIDTHSNHRRGTALEISGVKLFGWTVDPGWVPLACELQSGLLAAIADTDGAGAPASKLVVVVHDIAAAFLRPATSAPSSPPRGGVIATGSTDTFAGLKPAAAFEMLGTHRIRSRQHPERPSIPTAQRPTQEFQTRSDRYGPSLVCWHAAACRSAAALPRGATVEPGFGARHGKSGELRGRAPPGGEPHSRSGSSRCHVGERRGTPVAGSSHQTHRGAGIP